MVLFKKPGNILKAAFHPSTTALSEHRPPMVLAVGTAKGPGVGAWLVLLKRNYVLNYTRIEVIIVPASPHPAIYSCEVISKKVLIKNTHVYAHSLVIYRAINISQNKTERHSCNNHTYHSAPIKQRRRCAAGTVQLSFSLAEEGC